MTHKVQIVPSGKTILVEDHTLLKEVVGEFGIDFPCGGKGICGNCQFELLEGHIELDSFHEKILQRKGLPTDKWRLACLSYVTEDITIQIPEREQVILADTQDIGLASESGHTVAVDLGSTTIVVQLINRESGRVIASQSEINDQNRYGADIISRIAYAIQSQDALEELVTTVRKQIGRMIRNLLVTSRISDIRNVTIVGNSAMHHLFCGLDVKPLSVYPFQSPNNAACHFNAAELNWDLSCEVIFMPNISHFVGSDILAGILDLEIYKKNNWNALIDLGTNGEIVIGNKERIICASTAAGPAFEGVNITNGMRAITGAISHVEEGSGEIQIIGNTKATGICGSGLIDAVNYFLCNGQITADGQIAVETSDRLPLKDGVSLYEKDIREFQLAKAAISTGFELLLKQMDLTLEDIDKIYIGGGLGNYLNMDNAVHVGLVKTSCIGQLAKAGNSALSGCRKMTYDALLPEIEKILALTSHYSLETSPDFQEIYCNNLFFM